MLGSLWNAVRSVASSVYHTVAPKPKPVTIKPASNPLKVATGPTPIFPSGSVQGPAPARSPAASVAPTTYSPLGSTPAQRVLLPNGQVAPYDATAAQAAATAEYLANQRKFQAAQQSITARLKSNLAQWTHDAGYVAGTPGRYIGSFVAKRREATWLTNYTKNANKTIEGEVNSWNKKIGQAGKDLAAGKITPDQYNATVNTAKTRVSALAAVYNQTIQSTSAQISSPTTGRAGRLLSGALGLTKKVGLDKVWQYTLGSGTDRVPSIVTAPTRALNFARNLGWNFGFPGEGGRFGPPPSTIYKEGGVQGKLKPGLLNAWKATYQQRPFNLKPSNSPNAWLRGVNTALDLGLDPANYVTAGLWSKAGSKIGDASRLIGRFARPGADAFASTRLGGKAVDLGKWLAAPNSGTGGRYINKLVKQASKDYAKLNDNEINAYQDLMKAGGSVSKDQLAVWRKAGVDVPKVQAFAESRRALFDRLYQAESAQGINYGKRYGYFPTQRLVKEQAQLEKNVADNAWTPFFKLSKEADFQGPFTRKELASGEALRQWASQRALGTLPKNRLRKIISAPNTAWRTSVLGLRPAWYAYNMAWNIPASFLAGGPKTARAYARILRAGRTDAKALGERFTFRPPSQFGTLPEGVTGGLFGGSVVKGLKRPGSWIEDFSRVAAGQALKDQGLSDKQIVDRVNRYLFNYRDLRNIERPIRAVLPFWQFQKNINRLALELPFTNPKAARALHYLYSTTVEQPLSRLPAGGYTYRDPQTGEQVTYNPREAYKNSGRIRIPGLGWVTTPWLPILPYQLNQFGVSPWLGLLNGYVQNKDYFGNPVNDKSFGDNFANLFPQWKVGGLFVKSLNKRAGQPGTFQTWISESGYTKERQGYDPTKPNYTSQLDPSVAFKKVFRNFLGGGVLGAADFDEQKYRENMNYYQFSKDYFSHDWNKEFPDYNQRVLAQTLLAKRYGYNLQKDLYDGKWAKYDSPNTAKAKAEKDAAHNLENEVYKIYNQLPAGTGKKGDFIRYWKALMAQSDLLDRLPDFMVFKNVGISGNDLTSKYPASTTWAKPSTKSSPKNSTSFTAYANGGSGGTSSSNPFGYTASQRKLIAWAYKNLNPDVRRAYLKKKGLYRTLTQAQWDAINAANPNAKAAKTGQDLTNFPQLGNLWLARTQDVVSNFNPISKPSSKAVAFLPTPKRKTRANNRALTWRVTA